MSIKQTYNASMKVQHTQARKAREVQAVPEPVAISLREYHSALCKIAPRVKGERPYRLPYIRSNGEVSFPDRDTAKKAYHAMVKSLRALELPVAVELSPVPNPKDGESPWYQILGYLAGTRDSRKVDFEAGAAAL